MSGQIGSILEVRNLSKTFRRRGKNDLVAVDEVSFDVESGQCLGIVGESGSGKSTTANMIAGLLEPSSGSILLEGRDITHLRGKARRRTYRNIQMVFQNPAQSFDPRRTLAQGIEEALVNFGCPRRDTRRRAIHLLERCGLQGDFADRYPREVSGGQCQRAAIARALAPSPKLLVCDEATSALDVTVQGQIAELLGKICHESGMAMLFISHDIALVSEICNAILVMKDGRILEKGPVNEIVGNPRSAYTRALIDAVLGPQRLRRRDTVTSCEER